jgi:ADP-ribosylglycohydrolase
MESRERSATRFRESRKSSVPYTIWSAAKHLDNYRTALVETVLGDGDCDTNCAIVGGIVVLHSGGESIPEDWRASREPFDFELPSRQGK